MQPLEAFSYIDSVLASQRLSLTLPEFNRLVIAMQAVADALKKAPENENTARPSTL